MSGLRDRYVLILDTEATELPKHWSSPVSRNQDWPSAIQVAWVLYDPAGNELKHYSEYISDYTPPISEAAIKIHGLTESFLRKEGIPRKLVLDELNRVISQYDPVLVGHFIELDLKVLKADYCREELGERLYQQPVFCTMLASAPYALPLAGKKYLRLGEFHNKLFGEEVTGLHNALTDAYATARIFFQLTEEGKVEEQTVSVQHKHIEHQRGQPQASRLWLLLLAVSLLLVICIYVWIK